MYILKYKMIKYLSSWTDNAREKTWWEKCENSVEEVSVEYRNIGLYIYILKVQSELERRLHRLRNVIDIIP